MLQRPGSHFCAEKELESSHPVPPRVKSRTRGETWLTFDPLGKLLEKGQEGEVYSRLVRPEATDGIRFGNSSVSIYTL